MGSEEQIRLNTAMGQKKNNSIKGLPSFIPIEVGLGD
jgi:hypothetical protein